MKHSFIIQYFNHRDNILGIVNNLISIPDSEIIFHNDSNSDHDIFNQLIKKYLNLKVICSNNIHEIRGYNKCIKMAKGKYIWICQDDDIMNCNPVLKKLDILFELYDDLSIISLYNGGVENWGKLENKYIKFKNNELDNTHNINDEYLSYKFVCWANIGPLVIKKSLFNEIGLFDENYSNVGELGIGFDSEFTFRANLNNKKVAILKFDSIIRGVGEHSTKRTDKKRKERKNRCKKNRELYNNQYGKITEDMKKKINDLNNKLGL